MGAARGGIDGREVFIGYHASQEQLPPSGLLRAVVDAERVGFDGAFSADHVAPWTPAQGESGHTFAWLGAALTSTQFPIGAVSTPGYLYHPVITAQAAATLADMFPGRYFAALGSGELLNEHVTGEEWPPKSERTERLAECVDIMRRLLRGEEVTHDGRVQVDRARLWSLPKTPPALHATAASPATATWAADWADGLVTVGTRAAELGEIVAGYRDAGGRGSVALQLHISLSVEEGHAMSVARDQWRHAVVTPPEAWDIAMPEQFAELAGRPSDDEMREHVLISDHPGELAEQIVELLDVGFDTVYLHDVSKDQRTFLRGAAPALLGELRNRVGP